MRSVRIERNSANLNLPYLASTKVDDWTIYGEGESQTDAVAMLKRHVEDFEIRKALGPTHPKTIEVDW